MHTATLSLTASRATHDLRWVDFVVSLPRPVVRVLLWSSSALAAWQVRKMAETVSVHTLQFVELTRLVESVTPTEIIDPDKEHARRFDTMLDGIKAVHGKALTLRALVSRFRAPSLVESTEQLVAICAECHEAMAGLAWAVLEHDADIAPRRIGYAASTPEEIEQILSRIAAGE